VSDHGGTPLDMITIDYPDGNRIVHRLRIGRWCHRATGSRYCDLNEQTVAELCVIEDVQ